MDNSVSYTELDSIIDENIISYFKKKHKSTSEDNSSKKSSELTKVKLNKEKLTVPPKIWNYIPNSSERSNSYEYWEKTLSANREFYATSPYNEYPGRYEITPESDRLFRIAVLKSSSILLKYPNTIINNKKEMIDWEFFKKLSMTDYIWEGGDMIKGRTMRMVIILESIVGLTKEQYIELVKLGKMAPTYKEIFFKFHPNYSYNPKMTLTEIAICLDYYRFYEGINLIGKMDLPKEVDYQYVAKYMINKNNLESFMFYGDRRFLYETIKYTPLLYNKRNEKRGENKYSHIYVMEYLDNYCPIFKKPLFYKHENFDLCINYEWKYSQLF